ncbi:MAG TPA: methyltransferase domain-containing protein [Gaiellaceae bacterium]|nr:methyltransferase domain-containing protein [Gaiellaceae bacterium]
MIRQEHHPPDLLLDELALQERSWERNDLLRLLYRQWYRDIALRLSNVDGPTVELGSGIGKLREAVPRAVLTDVATTPWADSVVDAQDLPYDDASLANLVLVDVLHHIPQPTRFFDEAARALAPGGRIVLLEPYCSPVSYRLYRAFHHEPTDLSADPFAAQALSSENALDSNQAIPTLLFFRGAAELAQRWPQLEVIERRRLASIAYPLSGGWRRRPLLPAAGRRAALALEVALAPVARLIAFRCLVVLERTGAR